MARRKQKLSDPAPRKCEECGLIVDYWVILLMKIEPEEHKLLCDPCYLAEFAKPIRKHGVET
jgi:hypothetical protein